LAGGAAGLALAHVGTQVIQGIVPSTDLPIVFAGSVDGAALAVTFALSTLVGLVFGLTPAWRASRPDTTSVLREDAAAGGQGASRRRWFHGLVVVQVTLSVVLLVGAALFVRSLERARTYDVGFDPHGVAMIGAELFSSGYDRERGQAFYTRLLGEASALPGVERAALARRVPLGFGGSSSTTFVVDGDERPSRDPAFGYLNVVSPGYFDVMRIPRVAGRDFSDADTATAPRVAIINETMARRYWSGRDAVGGRFRIGPDWVTVVGVARDSTYRELRERPAPFFYVPLAQWYRTDMTLMARTNGDSASAGLALRDLFRRLDPALNVFQPRTLESHIEAGRFRQKLAGQLLGVLGAVGLLLAVVGLYGTLAFGVVQRRREIGVRLAVGGAPRAIVVLIVRDALVLVAIGTTVGLAAALVLVRPVAQLLLGVQPWDPVALGAVAAILSVATAGACALPAWRAASTDPVRALRGE
ncbi:MAG: ABC transporter permease, partial [Acidobacteria bacterium]|nr:ABC transporter permease [Acidobacteriota bacterium]